MSTENIVGILVTILVIYHFVLLLTFSDYDNTFYRKISIYYIIPNAIKSFNQSIKSHRMLNTKALIKALSFLCLPTLSVLLILYFWFLDFGRFTAFVTSDSALAGILRVILILAELVLVYNMYCYYDKIIPNDKFIDRVNKDVLGENYTHIGSVKRDGDNNIAAYNDSTISNYIDHGLPRLGQKYTASVYKLKHVPNTILIQTKPV